MSRVLVIDDDDSIRETVRRALEAQSYTVDEAADGSAGLLLIRSERPDVVVLDVSLPDMSGLEILGELRRAHEDLPVLLLTARADESDRVVGLDLGADDYLTKPFSVRELLARIRALLRRSSRGAKPSAEELTFGQLEIRPAEREVFVDGVLIQTTPKEFDLLVFLARHPRVVFTRDELLREVWSSSAAWQDQGTVTEHIRRLRKKLEPNPEQPRWLVTAARVGYRFEP